GGSACSRSASAVRISPVRRAPAVSRSSVNSLAGSESSTSAVAEASRAPASKPRGRASARCRRTQPSAVPSRPCPDQTTSPEAIVAGPGGPVSPAVRAAGDEVLPLAEEGGVDRLRDRSDVLAGGRQGRPADAPQHLRLHPFLTFPAGGELPLLQDPFGGELLEGGPGHPRGEPEGLDQFRGEEGAA